MGEEDVTGTFGGGTPPNVGVLLGTGGAVDIDLDSREAQLLAPYFLPKTGAVFGRRSKRRSHWLYQVEDPPRYRIFSDPRAEHKGEVLFEVRSDPAHQTMMPPSVHPSGEKVEWYEEGDPAKVRTDDLLPRIARLAAASLLAKTWPDKGARHQAAVHLAGGLLRAGWKVDYVEKYITAICNVAGDVKEVEDRTRAVRDTAKDLEGGGNVTGWPTLVEVLGAEVVRAVTDWLQVGGATAKTALTDLGNAERLIAQYSENIRYCPQSGHWLIWDGRRWAEDEGERILQLAAETARSIFLEAAKESDSDRAQQIAKWAIASQNINRLQAIPRAARSFPQIQVHNDDLDKDPWLLNCPNGTLNLRTGGLQPFSKEDYITRMAGTEFDPDAKCPVWEKFLMRVLHEDGELVSFIQRAVGYSLTGSTREQKAFILFGTGANGKTTFVESIRAVLGEYARNTEFSTFLQRSGDSVRTDVARLKGARLVTASESEEGRKLATALVKAVTGGELVTARFLYQSEFEYRPVLKMWLATNHKPVVRDNTRGFWRRIILVPFIVQIPEREWDRDLRIKLNDHELAGILNWALKGCQDWQDGGLGDPEAIKSAGESYRQEMDVIGDFLEETCKTGKGLSAMSSALYQAYSAWSQHRGERAMNSQLFKANLEARGFLSRRTSKGVIWDGLVQLAGAGAGLGSYGSPARAAGMASVTVEMVEDASAGTPNGASHGSRNGVGVDEARVQTSPFGSPLD